MRLRPLNSSSGETTSTERSTFHLFFIINPLRSRRCERFTKKVRIGTSSQPLSPHRGRPQMKGQHSRGPLSHLWLQERTEFKTCQLGSRGQRGPWLSSRFLLPWWSVISWLIQQLTWHDGAFFRPLAADPDPGLTSHVPVGVEWRTQFQERIH